MPARLSIVLGAGGAALALYYIHRQRLERARLTVRRRIREIMSERYSLQRGTLASETEDERLRVPALLGKSQRILLGDLGTVESLLECRAGDTSPIGSFLQTHPVGAVLVCMGSDAAAAVSREFEKKKLVYLGLGKCVDKEGYPLLANHLNESCAFIEAQLDATAPANKSVLVHCHEGKNRSAALCVAYLMVKERMPLTKAVAHVWQQRPIILDNQSFVDQLVCLAEEEGLLS
jgi:predicted protein tyrosine phosphatase